MAGELLFRPWCTPARDPATTAFFDQTLKPGFKRSNLPSNIFSRSALDTERATTVGANFPFLSIMRSLHQRFARTLG